ncbi:MAG: glycosyltransferase family 4 protein, partial [Chloroflexi bacterium]|nr:glycosyltransferase family 4 protein [Chloroflexota bacterium]
FARANVPSVAVYNGHPDIFRRFEQTGISVRRMEMPVSGVKQHINPFYRRRMSRQLAKFIEDERIDVLHLGEGGQYILDYLKKSNVLKVCVLQSSTPEFKPIGLFDGGVRLHPKNLMKAWYRKYVRLNYKRADLVLCNGEAALEAAIRTFHIKPERAVIIRPGISGRMDSSERGQIRREFGISANEKVVLSVGRITKAKGVEDFGEVARTLSLTGKNYRFLFAGRERDEAYGRMIRQKYGQIVTFIGHRTDIANVYADADLLVHLSHREGSPLVVIEALEFGVPCVAWDIPGTSEEVDDGVTGRTVPFGDNAAAADAIQQIFEQTGELGRLGSGARERFSEFSIDDYAGRLLAAYENRRRDIAKN